MPNLGTTELLIIAVVIMVLFGSRKLPGAARSLGQSMRIFKAETKAMRDEPETPTPVAVPVVTATGDATATTATPVEPATTGAPASRS